jgi:S1-C subfamily serine protease
MKKLFLLLFLLCCFTANAQIFNGYKYVLLPPSGGFSEIQIPYDDLNDTAVKLKKIGLIPIENKMRYPDFETGEKNPCEALKLEILAEMGFWIIIKFNFYNCIGEKVWSKQVKLADWGEGGGALRGLKRANKKILGPLSKLYSFDTSLTPKNSNLVCWFCPGETKKPILKKGEWAGNGSGIIISKSGYIVTNYHVIEDTEEIEVEFIIDGEVKKFNAEVIQSDKVNDLAVIKIFDTNFDGLDNLPYNFKTRSSDVGTKVYAYGYPMALSLMGKEIKITDGIISSKSGFDGDITTYQITAPIQGGNSGGPLFDDKGSFLGINSSGLRKDIADNVGYTIKSSYVLNLIDVLPKSIDLPSSTKLQSLPLTEQIKEISKYVVLVKVK